MKKNIVQELSFALGVEMIRFVRLMEKESEHILARQLLKSGTSIGANIEEAIGAESRKDFAHKLRIARKEARETHFWLQLLHATDHKYPTKILALVKQTETVLNLLHKVTKTLKDEHWLQTKRTAHISHSKIYNL